LRRFDRLCNVAFKACGISGADAAPFFLTGEFA
jgi:hypothetical protein